MTTIKIIQIICLVFGVIGDFFFRNLFDVVLSSNTSRTTKWGNKLLSNIEIKTERYFVNAANWKIAEKIKNTKQLMEKVIGYCLMFLLIFMFLGGFIGVEKNIYWLNFLSLFVWIFFIASIVRFSVYWTTEHKQAAKEFLKIFGFCAACLTILFVPSMTAILIMNPPPEGEIFVAISLISLTYISAVVSGGLILYLLAWTAFGLPVAVSGAFLWTTSKTAKYMVKNFDRETVINIATVLRFIKNSMLLIWLIITAFLYCLGVENIFSLR